MNGAPKLIKDIRFFEREGPDVFGVPMTEYLGKLYPEADAFELTAAGSRYALKLAERGLELPGFHHLYVTLTPQLPLGTVKVSKRQLEWWMRYVDVGLPLETWPKECLESQRALLTRASTAALGPFLNVEQAALVSEVEALALEQGPNLEILRLEKQGRFGAVRVTYQVLGFRDPAPVFIEFQDARSGKTGKIEAFRVKRSDDVFPLIGSITVSSEEITLKPRPSFQASLTTREYKTPIRIPIAKILGR